MPSDRARIASLVRGQLAIAGLSGRKLAQHMDWPVDSTMRRLRGDVAFRADELSRIADHLGVPIERLYREIGDDAAETTARATA